MNRKPYHPFHSAGWRHRNGNHFFQGREGIARNGIADSATGSSDAGK